MNPLLIFSSVSIVESLVLFFLLGKFTYLPLYISWLIACNIVSVDIYGIDKLLAQKGYMRVPEIVLYCLSIMGGAFGGLIAMLIFRHKTQHTLFWIAQGAGILLHSSLLFYIMQIMQ